MAGFSLEPAKWASKTITWTFAKYAYSQDPAFTHQISAPDTQQIVRAAFDRWESIADIDLVEVADSASPASPPDIRIGFGDLSTPTTGTIGMTSVRYSAGFFLPDVVIRLEDPAYLPLSVNASNVVSYTGRTTTLYQDALHEIGHALGLDHSSSLTAAMYPVLSPWNTDLSSDDIAGIVSIYGASGGSLGPPPAVTAVGTHRTLSFHGARSDYRVDYQGHGTAIVNDNVAGRDGTTTSTGNEVLQFVDSSIFIESGDNANIARLYSAALHRPADPLGLFSWEDIYANIPASEKAGGVYQSLAKTSGGYNANLSIADGFVQSNEFLAQYGTLSDAAFVNTMYRNVLDRDPDPIGLADWLNRMAPGNAGETYSRAMVLVGFAESAENIDKTASWLIDMSRVG